MKQWWRNPQTDLYFLICAQIPHRLSRSSAACEEIITSFCEPADQPTQILNDG
jgi:hypothetical protein